MKLDQVDILVLDALQADSGRPASDIARAVGITSSPFYRRQRILEEEGIIRGYVALLDQSKLGLKISVFVTVELKSQDDETVSAFEKEIRKLPEVMECYVMTGDADYLVRVVTSDIDEYGRLLNAKLGRIKAVRTIRSSFALRSVVHRTALPLNIIDAA